MSRKLFYPIFLLEIIFSWIFFYIIFFWTLGGYSKQGVAAIISLFVILFLSIFLFKLRKKSKKVIFFIFGFIILASIVSLYYFTYSPSSGGGYRITYGQDSSRSYVELDKILQNKENFVGKFIATSGDIVKSSGFNTSYILVDSKMVEENIHPSQGLDLSYNGDVEKFVKYDNPLIVGDQNKYTQRESAPLPLYISGKIIDRGNITDVARYSFEITDIQEVQIIQ